MHLLIGATGLEPRAKSGHASAVAHLCCARVRVRFGEVVHAVYGVRDRSAGEAVAKARPSRPTSAVPGCVGTGRLASSPS